MTDKIVGLIYRVGVSLVYGATVNEDGSHVDAEVTAAQAEKLTELLGEKNVKFRRFKGTHVVVRITVAELEKAAAEAQKVARGSGVQVDIASRVVYTVTTKTADAPNEVTSAWWEAEVGAGGITVNGLEYPIAVGLAKDYYVPEGGSEADLVNPDRPVYVVVVPTSEGELELTSYGVTNLIRRVASRNERIG